MNTMMSGMILTRENRSAQRETHPSDMLTTANTMWTGLRSNRGFFGDRLVTAVAYSNLKCNDCMESD
jgi:hypothetical protein